MPCDASGATIHAPPRGRNGADWTGAFFSCATRPGRIRRHSLEGLDGYRAVTAPQQRGASSKRTSPPARPPSRPVPLGLSPNSSSPLLPSSSSLPPQSSASSLHPDTQSYRPPQSRPCVGQRRLSFFALFSSLALSSHRAWARPDRAVSPLVRSSPPSLSCGPLRASLRPLGDALPIQNPISIHY